MHYFSTHLIETFQVKDEILIYNNLSIQNNIELADKIVMYCWLFYFCVENKITFNHLSIQLYDDIVYDQYQKTSLHSLLIIHEQLPATKYLHRLFLLNHNRIALIYKADDAYEINVYELLNTTDRYENEETLKWLKYKLAYENTPIFFENETNYFKIKL